MSPFKLEVEVDGDVIPVVITKLEIDENTDLMNIEFDVDSQYSSPMVKTAVGNFVLEALENSLNQDIAV